MISDEIHRRAMQAARDERSKVDAAIETTLANLLLSGVRGDRIVLNHFPNGPSARTEITVDGVPTHSFTIEIR